jgi:hypothetical protein
MNIGDRVICVDAYGLLIEGLIYIVLDKSYDGFITVKEERNTHAVELDGWYPWRFQAISEITKKELI